MARYLEEDSSDYPLFCTCLECGRCVEWEDYSHDSDMCISCETEERRKEPFGNLILVIEELESPETAPSD